jgi:hypothetical protein
MTQFVTAISRSLQEAEERPEAALLDNAELTLASNGLFDILMTIVLHSILFDKTESK